jgi:hypothetical protein
MTSMQRKSAALVTGAVASALALGVLVASQWPDLSEVTVGLLLAYGGVGLWLLKSPLQSGPPQ